MTGINKIEPKICIRNEIPSRYTVQKDAMQILPKAAFGGVNPASRNLLRRSGPTGRFCYCKIWVEYL